MLTKKSISAIKREEQQDKMGLGCLNILHYDMLHTACRINPVFTKVA